MMKTVLLSGMGAIVLIGLPTGSMAADAPAQPHTMHEPTLAEISAAAGHVWDRMDANHDGRLDAADRDARIMNRFAALDTNHDGVIGRDEFLAAAYSRARRWRGHNGDAPPPGDTPPPPGPRHGPGGFAAMVVIGPAMQAARHAAGPDGAISRAAFDAAIKARFDALDTNHDGTLSHTELRAAFAGRHRDGWRHRGWGRPGWRHQDEPGDVPPPPPPTH